MNSVLTAALREITPDMLTYFLKQKHWKEISSPNPRFFLFTESSGCDSPVELTIPKSKEFKDYILRISEAINTLADIFDTSQLSLIEEIKTVNLTKKGLPQSSPTN